MNASMKLGMALAMTALMVACADPATSNGGTAATAAPNTIAQSGNAPALPAVGAPGKGPH